MTHFPDDIYLGNAPLSPGAIDDLRSALKHGGRGVGPMGRVYIWDFVPVALGAAVIAALQIVALGGSVVLTAGAGVTRVTNGRGESVLQLDVPRCVSVTGDVNALASNYLIVGYDRYGQRMSQLLTGPVGANTTVTTKAFWQILSITSSAATVGNISVGIANVFGVPVRVTNLAYIVSVKWDGTLADNAATVVVAVATDPSTPTTGDVRGTVAPAGNAADGARRLVACIAIPAIGAGPDANRVGAFGINQNLWNT